MDALQKVEEPDLPAIPVAAEILQRNNNPNMVLRSLSHNFLFWRYATPKALISLEEVAPPRADQGADAQAFKGQLENAGFKSQSDCSMGIHLGMSIFVSLYI